MLMLWILLLFTRCFLWLCQAFDYYNHSIWASQPAWGSIIHIQMWSVTRLRHNKNGLLARVRGPGSRICVQIYHIVSLSFPLVFWYYRTLEGRQLQRLSPSRRIWKRFQETGFHRTLWDTASVVHPISSHTLSCLIYCLWTTDRIT